MTKSLGKQRNEYDGPPSRTRRRAAGVATVLALCASVLSGAIAVLALSTGTAGAAAPTGFVQIVATGLGSPEAIAAGADGNLWFTRNGSNTLGRVTPGGQVASFTDATVSSPSALALGPDGNIWFTNEGNSSIGRITPAGVISNFKGFNSNSGYVGPVHPKGIVSTGGRLFFTNTDNSIGSVNASGGFSKNIYAASINAPTAMAADTYNNVFFINSGSNSIGHIDAVDTVYNLTSPSINNPTSISLGLYGGMAFTNTGNNTIGGTDAGFNYVFEYGAASNQPYGIARGPGGVLWVTSSGSNQIGRLDLQGNITQYPVPVSGGTHGIAAGPDGNMWFTSPTDGAIGYIGTGQPGPPGAPSGVTAANVSGKVAVSWSAPKFDGFAPITSYVVTASPGGQKCTWTTGPLMCSISGLSNGTVYVFSVSAVNANGTGPPASSSAIDPLTVPSAPTKATAALGTSSAKVSWTASASTGGSTITGYTVTSNPGGKSCTWASGPLSCVVSGLTNGTAYTFTVTATNANGASPPSAPTASVLASDRPAAPGIGAVTPGNNSATVRWTAPCCAAGADVTAYTATSNPGGKTCAWTTGPLSCVVTGLTNGVAYTFTVTATNANGTGLPSKPSAPVVPPNLPGPPTILAALAGNATGLISWEAPGSDGGSPITLQTVTANPGGKTCTRAADGHVCLITGLTNGTAYTFTVTATNANGTGPPSAPSPSVTPSSVPGPPYISTVTPGDKAVTVAWGVPCCEDGAGITAYTVTSNPGGKTCTWTSGPLSCVVNGLKGGTTYTFTVTATNANGTGPPSSPSAPVTTFAAAPDPPSAVQATAGNAAATVTWSPSPHDGGSPITSYRATANPGGQTCWWSSGPLTCTITGLTNGAAYTFTVTATNAIGESSTTSGSVTPSTVPGAPATLTAAAGDTQATVSWTEPVYDGSKPITGYTATSNPGGKTCTWTTGPLSCQVNGLTNGETYTFTVTATNANGTGPASVPSVPVMPSSVPGPPVVGSATPTNSAVTATWSPPLSDGSKPVTVYTATATPGGNTCTWTTGPLTCTITGLTPGTTYTITVRATNANGTGLPSTASNPVVPWSGSAFRSLVPTRILDSRNTTGGWGTPLKSGVPRQLQVTDRGGDSNVPATATAVVVNVTATGGTAGSFLTAYPAGTPTPTASNLNFGAGQTIANLVIVKLGTGGQVSFANAVGSVDVIADVVGYYDDGTGPGDLYTGINPTRLLDSRTPNGGWNAPLAQGTPRDLSVRQPGNPNGVPATATAVIANITVTGASTGSFLSAWPSGVPQPVVSNLNFGAGQTIPNLAVIKIGGNGNIRFANAMGTVDVIVDVVGYFDPTGGSRFHAINPTRILDDRVPTGLPGPWGPNQSRSLPVAGAANTNVPAGATGLVTNVTATGGTTGSFITVYPAGGAVPNSSNVNFGAGETIPNLVTVKVPANGQVGFYNKLGNVDIIADAVGYYATT